MRYPSRETAPEPAPVDRTHPHRSPPPNHERSPGAGALPRGSAAVPPEPPIRAAPAEHAPDRRAPPGRSPRRDKCPLGELRVASRTCRTRPAQRRASVAESASWGARPSTYGLVEGRAGHPSGLPCCGRARTPSQHDDGRSRGQRRGSQPQGQPQPPSPTATSTVAATAVWPSVSSLCGVAEAVRLLRR